jgi:uncharacterized protein
MTIVLDTNLLLSSVSPRSSSHWLYQAMMNGAFRLCVTTEILNEYAEIIEWGFGKRGQQVSDLVLEAISNSPFTNHILVFYHWPFIEQDPDDNKFVDCAVAANVDFIVTEDRHFDVLATIDFPKLTVINLANFKKLLAQ